MWSEREDERAVVSLFLSVFSVKYYRAEEQEKREASREVREPF